MQIQLNGETRHIQADSTLLTLLEEERLTDRRVAVEVNGAIVPRAQHPQHRLQEGDQVEIVHALGGG